MEQSTALLNSDLRTVRTNSHELMEFVIVAFLISWSWLWPIAFTGGLIRTGSGWPTHVPALMGPLLAAMFVTFRHRGRAGLRDLLGRMLRVNVGLRWWAFAVSPLIVLVAVLGIDAVTGQALPRAADFAKFSGVSSTGGVLVVAAVLLVANGLGEESGWRGFALPRLQERFNPLIATLILSIVWAAWHLPMFFTVDTFRSFTAPIVVGWIIGLMSGAVVLTWLYNRSGGSILMVAVWHTTYNLISGTDAATGLLAAVSTTLVIVLALALLVVELRANRRGEPSRLGSISG